jgi:hypothetical protein
MSWTIKANGTGEDLLYSQAGTPSLDLRFAATKSLNDYVSDNNLITFTRASSGTFVDSAGVIQTAATDVPRFDHNPTTGESLGLLVEEQRTNSVVNSNSMTAVVTGSPGTLPTGWSAQGNSNGWTREVVGSGSIGALNYVDIRFSGTPTGSQFSVIFQPQGVVAASDGQSWAPSVYHQLVGGAISNISCFGAANLWNSSSAFIGSLGVVPSFFAPTSTLQRYTGSGTISNATTAFISWGITFTCTIGNPYDFTLRFAGPQLELGSFPTSYIPTTTAAATRSADVASITGSAYSNWFTSANESTFYVEGIKTQANVANGTFFCGSNTGVNAIVGGWITYNTTGAKPRIQLRHGSVRGDTQNNAADLSAGSLFKGALCTSTDTFAAVSNGSLVALAATPAQIDWGTSLVIGWFPNGGYTGALNGHIRRLTYWPQRLANSTLQTMTQ